MQIPDNFDDLDDAVDNLLNEAFDLIEISFDSPDEYEYYRQQFKRKLESIIARFINQVNKDRIFDKDLFDLEDEFDE